MVLYTVFMLVNLHFRCRFFSPPQTSLTLCVRRGVHSSAGVCAAAAVAMSKFDASSALPYEKLVRNLEVVKSRLGRPLTLSEKVLYSHLDDPKGQDIVRGESYLRLRPDRVAMQVCSVLWTLFERIQDVCVSGSVLILFFFFAGRHSPNGHVAVHLLGTLQGSSPFHNPL